MELRPQLTPNQSSRDLVSKLTVLAIEIDGAEKSNVENKISDFNAMAGTSFDFYDFQEIYSGCDHREWVNRILLGANKCPANPPATRDELIEVIRRSVKLFKEGEFEVSDAYADIFDLNVRMANAQRSIKYNGEQSLEEIVDQAMKIDDTIYL